MARLENIFDKKCFITIFKKGHKISANSSKSIPLMEFLVRTVNIRVKNNNVVVKVPLHLEVKLLLCIANMWLGCLRTFDRRKCWWSWSQRWQLVLLAMPTTIFNIDIYQVLWIISSGIFHIVQWVGLSNLVHHIFHKSLIDPGRRWLCLDPLLIQGNLLQIFIVIDISYILVFINDSKLFLAIFNIDDDVSFEVIEVLFFLGFLQLIHFVFMFFFFLLDYWFLFLFNFHLQKVVIHSLSV